MTFQSSTEDGEVTGNVAGSLHLDLQTAGREEGRGRREERKGIGEGLEDVPGPGVGFCDTSPPKRTYF